jgi:oligopeptidase B
VVLTIVAEFGCAAQPPVARRQPTTVALGGKVFTDDYWWLRNKADPAVIQYLNAENAYTDKVLRPTQKLQKKLYAEEMGRYPDVNESVPYRIGDWWYSNRDAGDDDYPVHLRRKGSPTTQPEVMIDENLLAKGHAFFDFGAAEVSPDGNLLAYLTDVTGNRQYVLQVKDLRSGKTLADQIPLVDSFTWMGDNRTICYVKQDAAKRAYRLYRHVLGTPTDSDPLLYEETDVTFSIAVDHTRDRKWITCTSAASTETEVRVLPCDVPAAPMLIEPRQADVEYYVDHRNGRFYIRTNAKSRNFCVMTAPDNAPLSGNWRELIAADPNVVISDFDLFAGDIVVAERQDGLPQLAIAPLPPGDNDPASGGEILPTRLKFEEPDYNVSLSDNHEFDPPAIRITYASLTTPYSEIDINLTDGSRKVLKQQFVGKDFSKANYEERRLFATADDGTKIPISIVYRKTAASTTRPDAVPGGPLLLTAYGSYESPEDVYFSRDQLSLLNRGVTCAIAHVRGGGEYGRPWYDGGRMKNKINTFTDFTAAARYLQHTGWTTPGKTAIEGASAGGLLIGAVVNREPELFRAAVADVPWVDVLADMSDPSIPLTTLEYTEWGNPNIPDQRDYIASYDPYLNVHPQHYPDLLVLESLNDSQVQYWDAARWVAKLRVAESKLSSKDKPQLLLKMDMNSGHDGPSGQDAEMRQQALINAWVLDRLGVGK